MAQVDMHRESAIHPTLTISSFKPPVINLAALGRVLQARRESGNVFKKRGKPEGQLSPLNRT